MSTDKLNTEYLAHRESICKHVALTATYKELSQRDDRLSVAVVLQVEQVVQAESRLVELSRTMNRRVEALSKALDAQTSVWDRFGQTGADLDTATAQREQAYKSLLLVVRVWLDRKAEQAS